MDNIHYQYSISAIRTSNWYITNALEALFDLFMSTSMQWRKKSKLRKTFQFRARHFLPEQLLPSWLPGMWPARRPHNVSTCEQASAQPGGHSNRWWNVFHNMCTMDWWSSWSWSDVNRSTFDKYTVSQKKKHYTLVHIFAKYWPIFTILSPTYSVGTVQ